MLEGIIIFGSLAVGAGMAAGMFCDILNMGRQYPSPDEIWWREKKAQANLFFSNMKHGIRRRIWGGA